MPGAAPAQASDASCEPTAARVRRAPPYRRSHGDDAHPVHEDAGARLRVRGRVVVVARWSWWSSARRRRRRRRGGRGGRRVPSWSSSPGASSSWWSPAPSTSSWSRRWSWSSPAVVASPPTVDGTHRLTTGVKKRLRLLRDACPEAQQRVGVAAGARDRGRRCVGGCAQLRRVEQAHPRPVTDLQRVRRARTCSPGSRGSAPTCTSTSRPWWRCRERGRARSGSLDSLHDDRAVPLVLAGHERDRRRAELVRDRHGRRARRPCGPGGATARSSRVQTRRSCGLLDRERRPVGQRRRGRDAERARITGTEEMVERGGGRGRWRRSRRGPVAGDRPRRRHRPERPQLHKPSRTEHDRGLATTSTVFRPRPR